MPARNVILTGIPRSGTTMTAALIDSFPDSVCLNEPRWQADWANKYPKVESADFVRWLIGDYGFLRQKLIKGEPIQERRDARGEAMTNYFSDPSGDQKREKLFDLVPFTRDGLSPEFTLACKHNGLYAAVLDDLVESGFFTIIAVIRHPVNAIASWRSLDFPISKGHMPAAERFWPQMRELSHSPIELLEKQVHIYDMLCQRFFEMRSFIHIVRYEDLIQEPQLVGDMLGHDASHFTAKIKKTGEFYKEIEEISQALQHYGTHYRHFYPDLRSY